jgi:hypothetical protein
MRFSPAQEAGARSRCWPEKLDPSLEKTTWEESDNDVSRNAGSGALFDDGGGAGFW